MKYIAEAAGAAELGLAELVGDRDEDGLAAFDFLELVLPIFDLRFVNDRNTYLNFAAFILFPIDELGI